MLSVLPHKAPPPLGGEVTWNSAVQNGVSCVMTHIPENSQKSMISATDSNQFQSYQPPSEGGISRKTNKNNDDVKNFSKNVLVENLVDTTVLIIDVIWYNFPVNPNSQVIPLRLFIQETLRRSRTSWSTLQTALLYLMTIKQKITFLWLNPDRWTLNSKDEDNNPGSDPATCGRRMFLASLIVASKYLQDRNYANNAWSKICGLPVQEINVIERRFLKLIDYSLFIAEDKYKHWANVLRAHIQNIQNNQNETKTETIAEKNEKNQQAVLKFERSLQQFK